MVVLWLTFLIFHLCYYFSCLLLQLLKCHCVEVTLLLIGPFHGSFHILYSIIDASCEANKCIPKRAVFNQDLRRIQCSFTGVVIKSKTEDEELMIEMRTFHLLRSVLFLHCQDKVSFITSHPPPFPIPFYNLPFALPMSPSGASHTPSYYF